MAIRPLMLAPPVLFAALAAVFYIGMYRENPDELPSQFIGQPIPALTEAALPGIPGVTAEALASGEVLLVNFWASWCPPCRAEHPRLLALQAQGVRIVGVNMKDTEREALSFLNELQNPFTAVAFDPAGRTSIDWGVTAPPETFVIAKDGTVLYRHIGPLLGASYDLRFVPALAAATGSGPADG